MIFGSGFRGVPNVSVIQPAGVTWTVTGATATSITGTITVGSSAPTGPNSFLVANLGTGPGLATGAAAVCACLTIT